MWSWGCSETNHFMKNYNQPIINIVEWCHTHPFLSPQERCLETMKEFHMWKFRARWEVGEGREQDNAEKDEAMVLTPS